MNTWTFPSLRHDGITLVAGLGTTGLAAIRWLLRAQVRVRVVDTRSEPAGLQALHHLPGHDAMELHLGQPAWDAALLEDVHTVVISPGLSPLDQPLRELLRSAREQHVDIVGETELFARALQDLRAQGHAHRLLAVTGTNGKTTVTAMTAHLLAAAGQAVQTAGNISPAALDALADALDSGKLPDTWVIELSSFQLYSTHSLQADAVALLNLSQDHLDWHGSFADYAEAKGNLLKQGALAIVNRTDPQVRKRVAGLPRSAVITFGSDSPDSDGSLGVTTVGALDWLAAGSRSEPQALLPINALRIPGQHNILNAQAAILLARAAGMALEDAISALPTYLGEPHRMAFVRNIAGVDFYNDSKGTNVAATVAALSGQDGRAVLIAGGQGKGQDFSSLVRAASRHAHHVVLIGEAAQDLKLPLEAAGVPCQIASSLQDAVDAAFRAADYQGRVVLSPACASHDMFADYIDRGKQFMAAVDQLALDQGEVA